MSREAGMQMAGPIFIPASFRENLAVRNRTAHCGIERAIKRSGFQAGLKHRKFSQTPLRRLANQMLSDSLEALPQAPRASRKRKHVHGLQRAL
jgi:hypothetical protein